MSVLKVLASVQHEQRITEGRLSGVPYAPYVAEQRLPRQLDQADLRALIVADRKLAGAPAPPSLAGRALVGIALGRFDLAVALLQTATARAPKAAALWNDLAVAYLSRARARLDPHAHLDPLDNVLVDNVLALDACERALSLEAGLLTARFNRGLAVERLGLPEAMATAWDGYLALDSSSAWAAEATRHREQIAVRVRTRNTCAWQRFSDLAHGGDATMASRLVDGCPEVARRFAEQELLPAWGQETAAGSRGASALLALAGRFAVALAAPGADLMLPDSVSRAEELSTQRSLSHLVSGLSAYRRGMGLLAEHQLRQAAALLSKAQSELETAHCAFAGWAGFERAVTDYYLGDYRNAERRLKRLDRPQVAARYPILHGRIAWDLGLIRAVAAHPVAALADYRRGLQDFERGHDSESLAGLHSLIAEILSSIGLDQPAAWEERRAALANAAELTDSTHRQTIFDEAAEAALRRGAAHAARLFQSEALGVAERLGDPQAISDALLRRLAIDRQLADPTALAADRARAEGLIQGLPDADLRRRLQGDLFVSDGDRETTSDPGAAALAYSQAIEIFSQLGLRFPLVRLLTVRAGAWEKSGDMAKAASDLQSGLREIDRQRAGLLTHEQRLRFFERSRSLFDAAISFAIRRRGDPVTAFRYAELGRSRTLLDVSQRDGRGASAAGAGAAGSCGGPLALDQVRDRLQPDEALIEYAVLDDRLIRWTVQRQGAAVSVVDVGAEHLTGQVEAFLGDLEHPARGLAKRHTAARELWRLLIPDGLLAGTYPRRLVVVPDRQLNRVPFAALIDPRSGQFLIQETELVVAPSASFYLCRNARPAAPGPGSALVLGSPRLGPDLLVQLPALPGSEEEARRIATLYPRSRLLLGEQATKLEFLRLAPSFRVVHFAGHGAFAGEEPALFLAPDGGDSGVLTGEEIEGMVLPRTRLVVLAACRSAGGKLLESEGPESAARAFLAAGAEAVVGSLFDLDDREVETLVGDLHRQVAGGIEPAAALRAAQLRAIADSVHAPGRRSGWAGLELIGVGPAPSPQLVVSRPRKARGRSV